MFEVRDVFGLLFTIIISYTSWYIFSFFRSKRAVIISPSAKLLKYSNFARIFGIISFSIILIMLLLFGILYLIEPDLEGFMILAIFILFFGILHFLYFAEVFTTKFTYTETSLKKVNLFSEIEFTWEDIKQVQETSRLIQLTLATTSKKVKLSKLLVGIEEFKSDLVVKLPNVTRI